MQIPAPARVKAGRKGYIMEKEYKEEMLAGELREMIALGWTPEDAEENPEAFLERIGQYADGLSEADVWRVWEAVLEQEFV